MGQKRWWHFPSPDGKLGVVRQLSRAEVQDVVSQALEQVKAPADQRDHVIRSVMSNPSVDTRAYKCDNGCGCPMTQAGFVLFGPDGQDDILDRPSWATNFVITYDRLMLQKLASDGVAVSGAAVVQMV